ncbi:hypothetical protein TNCV_3800311 [Trichonephila clavipes]|nr:hypothetical protein TNCV_3800311 [Trichonephila clavipes]
MIMLVNSFSELFQSSREFEFLGILKSYLVERLMYIKSFDAQKRHVGRNIMYRHPLHRVPCIVGRDRILRSRKAMVLEQFVRSSFGMKTDFAGGP